MGKEITTTLPPLPNILVYYLITFINIVIIMAVKQGIKTAKYA